MTLQYCTQIGYQLIKCLGAQKNAFSQRIIPLNCSKLHQELMSHPKGGEGAFNYVETALAKVLKCCDHMDMARGKYPCGSLPAYKS